MFDMQKLTTIQQNPQLMDQLINSNIDPNAIMAYQMGGAMPEMPGVTMGQPGAAQPPSGTPPFVAGGPTGSPVSTLPPTNDVWSQMGGMGQSMMGGAAAPARSGGPSPMIRYGGGADAKAQDFSSREPKRTSSLEDILAGFKK